MGEARYCSNSSNVTRLVQAGLLFVVLPLSLGALPAQTSALENDRAHRDQTTHWPKDWNPSTAPVFSHNELRIHADCHRVWTQFTDVTKWPDWFVLTKDVVIVSPNRAVGQGAVLHLKIFGTPITTRLDEFVPESRIGWTPKGDDEAKPSHYHNWRFVPKEGGCLVVTEEAGIGPNDLRDPQANSRFMHRAHDLWLASLKWVSEQ